jgi:hypothetical protein
MRLLVQTIWSELNDDNVHPKIRSNYTELEELFAAAVRAEEEARSEEGGTCVFLCPCRYTHVQACAHTHKHR